MLVAAASVMAALAVAQTRAHDLLLYNHSPSIPVGFYVRTNARPERGTIVTVRAALVAPVEARERNFTDPSDRFIKRIAGSAGDVVCADGAHVTINGERVAARRASDSTGRPLPAWEGCRTLTAEEIFLLGETADSFDGRYWGIVTRSHIESVWRRL
jgi:conjugative transfer signal peptidase TraF